MLTPTHPAAESEHEQTIYQAVQLQGAIDKTLAYLSLALEQQLDAIDDAELKNTVLSLAIVYGELDNPNKRRVC